MLISKEYISHIAITLLKKTPVASQAYDEITDSIRSITNKDNIFIINN